MIAVFANILQPLIDFFHAFLEFFHDKGGLGWGASIVALTILVRAVLLPLTYKSSKGMIRLQQLAPEMKGLQAKYKDDPQRLQQETMKFYKENQVNPFASCLPMIAQLPVFLALFYMLQADLRRDICPSINPPGQKPQPCGATDASQFLFVPDLTDRATGGVLVALIVLYVGSQLVSTLLMSTTTDRNQRIIFLALPFVFIAFIWQFPAGLLVYWITTNLWTILQQAIIKKRLGPLREEVAAAAKAAKEDRALAGVPADGKPASRKAKDRELVGTGAAGTVKQTSKTPPPSPPRKKKKRSGRRR
ncbi:MAG TPA: YidC/Oxa1 family membrane protein insertase [Solirubrobacteraceae bacterium]|nr:YidC/Oxa1 family membrane protein insertase [Solirubrobacteraceae bacterium]